MGWLYSKITVLEWGWMCHHWGQRQFNSGLLEEHMIELNSTVLAHIWTFYFLLADVNNVSFKLLEAHHSSSTCSVTWEGQWKDLISTLSWILMLKSQSNLHSVDIKQMMKRKHASEWNFKGIKSCSLYIFWALGGFHEIWKSCCVCVRALWSDWTLPFPAVCLNSASVCTVLSGWLDWLSLMLPVSNLLCPKKHLETHLRGRPSSTQWWRRASTWFSI